MTCTGCGNAPGIIRRRFVCLCQFCWDCLRHELKIRLDAIRDHGEYHRDNRGPNFGATFATGPKPTDSLGYGLYLSRTPQEAMGEAGRIGAANGWQLLRLDIQKTLTDIYVSEDFTKYLVYSKLKPLAYNSEKYGGVS